MKRIVFYVNHFGNGGVDRHITNLANELINKHFEITILVRGTILSNRLYKLDNRIRVLPLIESYKGLHNSDKLRFCLMGIKRNVQWLIFRGQQSFLERLNKDSKEIREKRRAIEREKTIVEEYKQDSKHLLRFVRENRDCIYVFFSISVMEQFCYITKSMNIKTVFAEARDPSRWTLNLSIMTSLLLTMNACIVQTKAQAELYRKLLAPSSKIYTVYNPMPKISIKHDPLIKRKRIIARCKMKLKQ